MNVIKKLLFHPLLYIFILGLFLRTYRLGEFPYGFHVDEVKIGWNAYSLFKTGRDDWWHAFPLHYDTFGDQSPTGAMYASVPAIALLGLNVFAVRFTSALFGALGVIAVFFLARLLTTNHKLPALAALMAAISPWHITLSRATSEGIIATTLILFGLVFLLKKWPNILISGTLLILSYFFYPAARLLVPLFVITITVFNIYRIRKISFRPILLSLSLLLLTITFALSPIARSRLNQISIFKDLGVRDELDRLPFEEGQNQVLVARIFHNKIVLYATRFANEYFSYFSPKFFLTFGEAKPLRYATVLRGPMLYIEFILLIIGLGFIAKKINLKSPLLLLLLLLLISPLAAALTTEDAPNLHRALLMSPFISIIAGLGLYTIQKFNRKVFYFSLLLLLMDLIYFSHMYLVHNESRDALSITRNSGVEELLATIDRVSGQYHQIILTNRPDPLYKWYAFSHRLNPFTFNQLVAINKDHDFSYSNITFSQFRCPSQIVAEKTLNDTLAVDSEGCDTFPKTDLVAQIRRQSGGIPYTLWTYQPPSPKL